MRNLSPQAKECPWSPGYRVHEFTKRRFGWTIFCTFKTALACACAWDSQYSNRGAVNAQDTAINSGIIYG